MHGHCLTWVESVIAALQHEAGKTAHDRLCLEVQVPHHDVRLPAAKEANDVAIDGGAEEGHGATSTEAAG